MTSRFLLISAVVVFSFASEDEGLEAEWKTFKEKYERKYSSNSEEAKRRKLFAETLQFIKDHNERFAKGLESHEVGVNQFADMVGPCKFNKKTIGATLKEFRKVPATEKDLQIAVATQGPVSVAIDASLKAFMTYRHTTGQIFDHPECSKSTTNHLLLVVGYGEKNGKKYWIVKNSWGTDWGNNGYGLMARDKDNQCGIANWAYVPVA
ncbi:hypothetical protein V5799_016854 [Amblyomma americanum]|uniref:Uncharacterized protein n=1 Tax=Amblyomma americanum TaxID=6943 RepID=A0AAQ4F507_AMBAM